MCKVKRNQVGQGLTANNHRLLKCHNRRKVDETLVGWADDSYGVCYVTT